ncbi:NACHT domain-containing protein [Nonomuraea rhodomycinica]|uniref:AAA family ATPase n=1 Tax=Nonomuraea rhodomycinica TaxID=1712872 RepID=A0A7Y6IPE0_9ACTN|nr:AAA family ATPase [Nonomuraea rhodomycinica]NUW40659.1 AAA family ATPase [Nonomuraea rhodomycinica]
MTQDQIGLIASVVATVAALVALRFDMFSHAHGREEAFRRVGGWTIAVLGAGLAGLGAFVWLGDAGVPPVRQPEATPALALLLGLALMVTGVVRVVRTPAEPDVDDLRHILKTFEARLDERETAHGRIVDPLVAVAGRFSRVRPISRVPRGNAKVTFVVGEAGAGKSLALRELAREKNRRELRRKRPREVALYVDLAALADAESKPTAELVRNHVHLLVSDGDSVIAGDLRRLMEGRRRLRWILLFDGVDDLAAGRPADPARTSADCLDAIRQFADSRSAFRAVVAVREAPASRPDEQVLPLAPLGPSRQREMAARRGLTPDAVDRLRSHLAGHPELARAATSPMVMGLLLDHVERAGTEHLPPSPYELMEVVTAERLEPVRGSLPAGEVVRAAERLAARAIDPGPDAGDHPREAAALVEALVEARVVRGVGSGAVVFTGRLVQDHYAARRLMSRPDDVDARRLLTTPSWREPVTTCLRLGPDEVREPLLAAACDVLEAQLAGSGWAVADVAPYLAPSGRTSSTPTPTVAMSWPASMANVLDVLSSASSDGWNVAHGSRLTPTMDRIVVSAFVRGDKRARRHAVALLPLASPEVVTWVLTRLDGADGSGDLMREAAERLGAFSGAAPRLPGGVRLMLLLSTLTSAAAVGRLLRRPGTRPHDMTVLVRATMRLLQVLAVMGIGRSVASLVNASLVNTAEGDTALPFTLMITGCGVFLAGSGGPRLRPMSSLVYSTVAFPVVCALAMAASGLYQAALATLDLLSGSLNDAVVELLGAAAYTWPVALVTYMGWTGSLPGRQGEWLFPHLRPARAMFVQYVAGRHPAEILRNLTRGIDRVTVSRLAGVALLTTVGAVLLVRRVDLPNVAAAEQENARAMVCVGLVFLGILIDRALVRWKRRIRRTHTAMRVESGHLTAEEFLGLFQEAGSSDFPGKGNRARSWETPETDFLLRSLRNSPPRALRHAMPAIRDVEAVLRHIGWLVPKDSNDPIPEGVWAYDPPAFAHPGFLEWVIEYDERFPGQLVRLAAARHDRISRLVEEADA